MKKWAKENFGERWSNRLGEARRTPSEVFVLKSHFNPVWAAYNVHELGKQVTESWLSSLHSYEYAEQQRRHRATRPAAGPGPSSWVVRAGPAPSPPPPRPTQSSLVQRTLEDMLRRPSDEGNKEQDDELRFRTPRLTPSEEDSDGDVTQSSDLDLREGRAPTRLIPTGKLRRLRWGHAEEVEMVLDIRSVGFTDRSWLVSRRRNKNLGDYASIWKKNLLQHAPVDDVLQAHVDEWL